MKNLIRISCLFLFFIFLFCCKNESPEPLKIDCYTIKTMMASDQELRGGELAKNTYFGLLDSLLKDAGYPEGLEEMNELDGAKLQDFRDQARILEKRPLSKIQQMKMDSLWTVQKKIDAQNTRFILNVIKTYGLDSLNNLDRQCDENSLFVFVHSPEELMADVRKVVEANEDLVGENRFRHIMWHLNGRNSEDRN